MKPVQSCCEEWAKAHEACSDKEMYGSCIYYVGTDPALSPNLDSVKFCPWCAKPKGVPTPELTGTTPLVLFFGTEADRQDFIQAIRDAKPGMITKHL